ncbi:amidohydrolase [Virgibacillus pantothenticus]|uniref:M20 metallopeptidase family protein n=1 Tax=Virgibacillus pantothenticus TaxID=1473 RepID=UPI001C246377|nr:M20 family metallopeptidase [Virgibacillus pantothenticus]MBU8567547.1 amidohydrolase [Virgibacillus pantothenticus]MBU8601335.1 amidohydrolase [Virgibacillus pantothenticus]MBU8636152.1 amidohydrolase [Virgibacillus pantothenticus]MBU8643672.1 amidohydrolase [Virgibacillus pantothenticus]MBU8648072.1 amidohydrolase [Virgibacillus pantothenticus]
MKNTHVAQEVKKIEKLVPFMRRFLHQNPELSNEEERTSAFIQDKLHEFGIPFEIGYAKYGVLGIIHGKSPGKTVALRADMDALPIQELNDHPYRSTYKNKMHACGHDAHMAMLLGAGYVLKHLREEFNGTVLLVFQPAEEDAPEGGAQRLLNDGIFYQYVPDVIYGQHVWPDLPVGQIGVRDKEMMGASDRFEITLTGIGGHASMPHQTTDVMVTLAHIITSLQTIVSRSLDPLEASVVTISKITGGEAANIIPNQVKAEGSIRTYAPSIRTRLKERFFKIINQIAEAFDVKADIIYQDGYPATINNPKWAAVARQTAKQINADTPEVNPSLAGEDFSRFLEKFPGAFIWLGTQLDDATKQAPLHDARFQINECALPIGTSFLAQLAINTLHHLEEQSNN